MGPLILFMAERVLVSTPDILIGGLGGYLVSRGHGRGRGLGSVILVLYAMAIVGTFIGDAENGEPFNVLGPVCGLLSAGGMTWLARSRHVRVAKSSTSE